MSQSQIFSQAVFDEFSHILFDGAPHDFRDVHERGCLFDPGSGRRIHAYYPEGINEMGLP